MIRGTVNWTEADLDVEGDEAENMVEMVLMIITMKSWIADRIGKDMAKSWWQKTKRVVDASNDWPRISITEMK